MIKTLESLSQDNLIAVFNEAFSDYIIPVNLTPQMWEYRCKRDRIDPSASYGYFEDDKICGFILHGTAPGVWYNGGTGVIPSKRGRGITKKIYEKILEDARKRNIKQMRLEVITTNTPAVKIYQDIGFKISRELICFKGTSDIKPATNITIKENSEYRWDELKSFWEYTPPWQLNREAVEKTKNALILAEAFAGVQKAGYIIYNPSAKQIMQFAAREDMRAEVFNALFNYIQQKYSPEMAVNNIDSAAARSLDFIRKAGLKETIRQHEMISNLL